MSTFYQWFSNICSPSQCLFFWKSFRLHDILFIIIKLLVRHFSKNSPFRFSTLKVFVKKFTKLTESYIYTVISFSVKFKVAGWKETPVQCIPVSFSTTFLRLVRTAAPDILGYPYLGICSVTSTLKKSTVFSSILVFIHFKLILESCTTSGVYLQPYQTPMMKL